MSVEVSLVRLGVGDLFCSLLTINGFKILLDCGWDEGFDVQQLAGVARCAWVGSDACAWCS
jgi:hypothetical protein